MMDLPNPAAPHDNSLVSVQQAYEAGRTTFARMFTRWMDGNGWSHPQMTFLARAAMGGTTGWLHSSQIASLRAGETRNPGPRTFVAIERLNFYVWRYATHQKLIPNTSSSNDYREALPILEGGQPPPLGWFVEVFAGYRVPLDFDMALVKIPPDQAERCAKALGRMLRRLITERGYDLIDDLSSVLHTHYPTRDPSSLDLARTLIRGTAVADTPQLEAEMANLAALVSSLSGTSTPEDELLRQLRR